MRLSRLSITIGVPLAAAIGSTLVAFVPETQGLDVYTWISGTIAASVAAWLAAGKGLPAFRSGRAPHRPDNEDGPYEARPLGDADRTTRESWNRAVLAIGFAGFLAVAVDTAARPVLADVALIALVGAIYVAGTMPRGGLAAAWLLTALGCGIDATCVVWPLGIAWESIAHRQRRVAAFSLPAAAVVGVVFALAIGHVPITNHLMHGAAHYAGRDVTALLPLIALGLAGAMLGSRRGSPIDRVRTGGLGVAALAFLALLLGILGLPLSSRVVALLLMLGAGAGLTDLRAAPVRIRAACTTVLVLLLLPGLRQLVDGAFLLFYLLDGR